MKTLFRFFAHGNLLVVIVPLYLLVIRFANRKGRRDWRNNSKNIVTVLAIHSERFRGDLEILDQTGCVRILQLPVYWQWQLVEAFVPKNQLSSGTFPLDWYRRSHEKNFTLPTLKLQEFLMGFLPRLYNSLKVDVVMTPNIRYACDLDWLFVTRKIGVPSVVLYRESLLLTQRDYSGVVWRFKKLGRLLTDHVIAHNHVIAKSFVESGIAKYSNVSICGNLRMDQLQKTIENWSRMSRKQDKLKVALFYFPPQTHNSSRTRSGSWNGTTAYNKIVEETISAFLLLAKARSDVEFVLKPKREHLGPKSNRLFESDPYKVLEKIDPAYRKLTNFSVQTNIDVHELLLSSTVVCGFYSTVLLEAALVRKPVVLPLFDYFDPKDAPYTKLYPFIDHLDLFEVTSSKEQFISTILQFLEWPPDVPIFDEQFHEKRRKLFEEHVSAIDGGVCRRTIDVIVDLVESKPRRRVLENQESDHSGIV